MTAMAADKEVAMTPTLNAMNAGTINAVQRKFIQSMGQGKIQSELLKRLTAEPDMPLVQRWTRKVLRSNLFDYLMSSLILSNMVAMIIEIDWSTEDEPVSTTHWTAVFGWVVLIIFIIELLARLYADRCDFFLDNWNKFDFLIVAIDTLFSFVGLLAVYLFPVSILRIFRLAKLVRISKVMRVFPELRLLIAGVLSSVSAIFWGTVLLAFALLVWSMVAVLFIHPLNKEVEYDESCPRCPRAYSSVMQSSLTFWQQIVTGDSWGQATIPVIEKEPVTAVFFVAVYLSLGMAVINLILGVVVSVADRARQDIESDDQKEDLVVKAEQTTRLLGLCMKMDVDNDGVISHEEICNGYEQPGEFRDALLSLEITRDEIEIVWKVIDSDQQGVVPYEDVVSALYAVKTSDTQFMLAYIKHYITVMKDALLEAMKEQYKKEEIIERTVREARRDILEAEENHFEHLESDALKFGYWQRLNDQQRPQIFRQEDFENTTNSRSAMFFGPEHVEIRTSGIASMEAKAESHTVFNKIMPDMLSRYDEHSESRESRTKLLKDDLDTSTRIAAVSDSDPYTSPSIAAI